MKQIITFVIRNNFFLILTMCSFVLLIAACKKCYQCSNVCYNCIKNTYNQNICSDVFENMLEYEEYIQSLKDWGAICTNINSTKNEEVCSNEAKVLYSENFLCK